MCRSRYLRRESRFQWKSAPRKKECVSLARKQFGDVGGSGRCLKDPSCVSCVPLVQVRCLGWEKNHEPFEFVNKMVDKTVVEVFATQVSVAGSRFDLEDTLFDCKPKTPVSSDVLF